MYVSTRIFRNSLLCGFIFASASAFQISNALTTEYIIPADGGKSYGNGINSTPRQTVPKNMPQGMGATGYGRASYGWRGTITTGSTIFKQLLLLEGGLIALDWIQSQYRLASNEKIIIQENDLKIAATAEAYNFICESGECFGNSVHPNARFNTLFEAAADLYAGIYETTTVQNACFQGTGYCTSNGLTFNEQSKKAAITINYYNKSGTYWGGATGTTTILGNATSIGKQEFIATRQAGEPTITPDPEYTGAIIDQFAGISPALRAALSETVTFLSGQSKWRLTDPLGNVIKDYEGVLEQQIEPIANPHKTATPDQIPQKGKVPVIEPAPIQKTTDLTTGEEAKGNTQNITNITNITNNQEKADLSKVENAITEIGAEPADPAIPELELQEWGEIEITTPEATNEQINEQAEKIRRTVTEEQVIQKAESLIGMHAFNYETFGNSRTCPPPRKMRFLTVEFDLPFDLYCDYIKQIVLLMIGLIPLGVFIYFLKNLFIHG